MKKVAALFLLAVFLVSVAGCTPKSEYDKLLIEKGKIQKKCNDLSSVKVRLENQLSSKEKDLKEVRQALKQANANVSRLEKELAEQASKNAQ